MFILDLMTPVNLTKHRLQIKYISLNIYIYIHGDVVIHNLQWIETLAIMPNAARGHGVHNHTLAVTATSPRPR